MNSSDAEYDGEDLLQKWREVLLAWTNCNQRRLGRGALSDAERVAIQREWWALTSEALWLNVRLSQIEGGEITPQPITLFATLADMAGDLSNGVPSDLLHGIISPGAPTRSARERLGVYWALRYIKAVKQGLISDRAYNKTVRTAYGVSAEAVRAWMNSEDEICIGIPETPLSPDQLKSQMLSAGVLHKANSRSHSAIERRSLKKIK